MTGLVWKLNRLRAMGGREIAHRGVRWAGQKLERASLSAGRLPFPAQPVCGRRLLFPQNENWRSAWVASYHVKPESLDLLLQGKIDFFGHPPLDVGSPVDWHRDPQTGIRAPLVFGKDLDYRDDRLVGNVKYVWELGRHQHLVPIAVAYAVTGESRYRDAVVGQVAGWVHDNPYGMGIHWCSAIEVALRLISWSIVHSLVALRDGPSGLFGAMESHEQFGLSIYRQTKFIRNYLSRYSSANNHLIGELTGLWTACQIFDMGMEGQRWGDLAKAELERQARLQVYEDGVDKEQAFYYHLWVLEYLFFAWLVGERAGDSFSAGFRERVISMAQFLHDVTPSGGQPPQVGDSDDGFLARFEPAWPRTAYDDVLAAVDATQGAGCGDSGKVFPQKAFWYSMILGKQPSQNKNDKQQTPYPRIYRAGGYAVLGEDGTHLVFDAGSLGYPSIAAHGHADALSFCMAVDGGWWLVDPGTFSYHSESAWRDYFRGTAAHNTVTVDGQNQSEIGGPFLWVRHAESRFDGSGMDRNGCQWAEGNHDGYKHLGIIHHRRIEFCPRNACIQISDLMDGKGEHGLAIYFHFSPDVSVIPGARKDQWVATKPGSSKALIFSVDTSCQWDTLRGSESPVLGWYSPALGKKLPAFTLRGRLSGAAPIHVKTLIYINNI